MRFCVVTLGCKANQYDTGIIEEMMRSRGHMQMKAGEGCDVCIVNTCAVTAESVRKSRQAVRRMKKAEPGALIAVCGCYTQLEGGAAAALGADIVSGTEDREGFVNDIERLCELTTSGAYAAPAINAPEEIYNSQFNRTRALLKIQDGCDNCCAYCIIPQARGHSRSVPPAEIFTKARELEMQGFKEIVITGIEISSYSPGLPGILHVIRAAAPGARLRLGSLNPDVLTAGFIRELRKIRNLCSHFHISLQSGCGDTLSRMGRRYGTDRVYESIGNLRGAFPGCGITADLIAGFPGETDAEFGQTLSFIEQAAFSGMHIFPFSPRPGTKAAGLPGQVSGSIKRARTAEAKAIAAKMSDDFKRAQTGKTLEVLFETKRGRYCIGHSGNYLAVAVPAANKQHGKIDKNTLANVKISSIKDGVLHGEIV